MSEPSIFRVATQVHGRVLLRHASLASAPLLIGFHGYGENAEEFLETITKIPGVTDWHVAVIEALHPFYNRKRGTVVANWMTRQDRNLAILDNVAYVAKAIDEICLHVDNSGPTVFIGFSQGTAMAYRAAWFSGGCDGLIALGGDAPSDAESEPAKVVPRILIGRGRSDRWYDENKLEDDVARLKKMGSLVETSVFDGGHEWTETFLTAAGVWLRQRYLA
jgi:predicted esterase